jgi:2'-5' RNA ligase
LSLIALQPFVVTAKLEESAFNWFDDLRQEYFPKHRNLVPAHLTLFHALPGEQEAQIGETLKAVCRRTPRLTLEVRAPWFLGRGVAYRLSSPQLERVRDELAERFRPWLTRQDDARWRPHITVQNKVEPEVARALLESLQHEFEPFSIVAEGLCVWRYLGGPWEPVADLSFSA